MSDLPRSVWNGSLKLRELIVPVGLAPTLTDGSTGFRLMHDGCGQLISTQRVCPDHGPVPDEEIVKAFEVAPGEHIRVDPADLTQVAPLDTRIVDVFAIIPAGQLNPLLARRAYWLLPGKTQAGRAGYAALAGALNTELQTGLARFTFRDTEWLAAIQPAGAFLLTLRELAPDADLCGPGDIPDLIAAAIVDDRTITLARKLTRRLEIPYTPELLTSLHRDRVARMLDGKLTGRELIHQTDVNVRPIPSGDIPAALQDSLQGIPRSRADRLAQALV